MNTTYAEDVFKRAKEKKTKTVHQPREDGKFNCTTVAEMVEILTGKVRKTAAKKINLNGINISLVLSSKEDGYYRVTPDSCTCKGWHFSQQKYGVGQCRHHTLAFPEEAAQNEDSLLQIRGPRKLARPPADPEESLRPTGKWPGGMNGPFDDLPSERRIRTEA
ncbi:MAG: hypothetical protein WA137_06295 [Methanothrix sp.]